jgi:hypothetical protein
MKQLYDTIQKILSDMLAEEVLRPLWPTDQLKEFLSSGHLTGRYNRVQTEIYVLLCDFNSFY